MIETPSDKDNQASGSHKALVKKLYQKPILTKMGALRDMTMAKNSGKVTDGSKSKYNNKTGRGGLHAAEG
ncbi:MAG: hypothetical protein WCK95_02580 [Alphaproteobacteria bacterium]|jgi:hypothetical protein